MKAVGVSIEADALRLVCVERNFQSLQLLQARELSLHGLQEEERQEVLSQLRGQGLVNADRLVCALPTEKSYLRMLALPPADSAKTTLLAQNQLDGVLPESIDEKSLVATQILSSEKGKPSQVLAAAASIEDISATLQSLSLANLDPQILTTETSALCALVSKLAPPEGALFVELGRKQSHLLFVSQGSVQGLRSFSLGMGALLSTMATQFGISQEEALQQASGLMPSPRIRSLCREAALPLSVELRRSLLSWKSSHPSLPRQIIFLGEGASITPLCDDLAAALGLEKMPLSLASLRLQHKNVTALASLTTQGAERFAKALGLALAGLERQPVLSFRQGSLAFRGDFSQLGGRLVSIFFALLFLFFVAGTTSYARYKLMSAEAEMAEADTKKIAAEIAGKEFTTIDGVDSYFHGKDKSEKKPWPETTAFDILLTLGQKIPKEMPIDINRMEIRAKKMTLAGEIDNAGDVDAIISALKDYSCFKELKPGSVKQITTRDGKSRHEFTLNIDTVCP